MTTVIVGLICLIAGAICGVLYGGRLTTTVKDDIAKIKGKLGL